MPIRILRVRDGMILIHCVSRIVHRLVPVLGSPRREESTAISILDASLLPQVDDVLHSYIRFRGAREARDGRFELCLHGFDCLELFGGYCKRGFMLVGSGITML